MKFSKVLLLLMAVGLLTLAACGKDEDKTKPNEPVEKLYNDALDHLEAHEYKEAKEGFDETERQHPYSEWALKAEIMAAYTDYRSGKYDSAIGDLDRFVKQHPNNSNTPYAYYLKSLCYYDQITDVGRDQKITVQAQQALGEVVRRFPDSEYARDARIKLDLVSDHLAGKEMEIGRYYERHQDYLAAINRFRVVVEKYPTTSHTPEALNRLVECYLKLGVTSEAQRYAAVLGYNYPGSIWYKDSYSDMNGKPIPPEGPIKGTLGRFMPF